MSIPTLAEMVASCAGNRDLAERQMQRVQQEMARDEPGPGPGRDRLLLQLSGYRAEFHHWADYVAYYRARVSAEGRDAEPSMTGRQGFTVQPRPTPAPGPDPRLPREREPGEDNE